MFKITNGNEFDFTALFDGVPYAFPAHQEAMVEDEPARHIFGIGQPDKLSILARHGWATVATAVEVGMAILNNFKFEHMEMTFSIPLASRIASHGSAPVVQNAPADEDPPPSSESAGAVRAHDEHTSAHTSAQAPEHRGPGRPRKAAE